MFSKTSNNFKYKKDLYEDQNLINTKSSSGDKDHYFNQGPQDFEFEEIKSFNDHDEMAFIQDDMLSESEESGSSGSQGGFGRSLDIDERPNFRVNKKNLSP